MADYDYDLFVIGAGSGGVRAARLAAMGKPYLFYEVTEGGHGSGANLEEKARTTALEFTYFIRKLMD